MMRLPQRGQIESYALSEAAGSELTFGSSALCEVVPALGVRVLVTRVSPRPSGGFKATVIASVEHDDPEYLARLAWFARVAAEEIEAIRSRLEEGGTADERRVIPQQQGSRTDKAGKR